MLKYKKFDAPNLMFHTAMRAWLLRSERQLADFLGIPNTTMNRLLVKNELSNQAVEYLDLLGFDVEIKLVPKPGMQKILDERAKQWEGGFQSPAAKGLVTDPMHGYKLGDFSGEEKVHSVIEETEDGKYNEAD